MKAYLFLGFIFLLAALPVNAAPSSEDTLSVGAILPLTGDGAFWGINPKRGIELALRDAKDSGASRIRITFEDDKCDPKQAVTAFRKLRDVDRVRAILGPSCSSSSLAVAPLAQQEQLLLFPFSEADSLSQAGDFIFRLWIPSGRQARRLAAYLIDKAQLKHVALLSAANAYGEEFAKAFAEEFRNRTGSVVLHETYSPDSRDLRAQMLKLKSKRPEALVFSSYIADGMNIVKQTKELGLSLPLFGCSTLNSPDFFRPLGTNADGLVFFDLADTTDDAFRQRWKSEFNSDWPGLQSGAPVFYDFTRFLVQAINEVGTNPVAIRDYFASDKSYRGVALQLKFDRNGDLIGEHVGYRVENGTPERIAGL